MCWHVLVQSEPTSHVTAHPIIVLLSLFVEFEHQEATSQEEHKQFIRSIPGPQSRWADGQHPHGSNCCGTVHGHVRRLCHSRYREVTKQHCMQDIEDPIWWCGSWGHLDRLRAIVWLQKCSCIYIARSLFPCWCFLTYWNIWDSYNIY